MTASGRTEPRRERLMRWATYAAVCLATLLISVKTVAWFATGSVVVLSSLIDSLLDGAASLINLFAVRQALTPADDEHRFGHGKAEPLAALGQAVFIGASAVFILLEAVDHLIAPKPVEHAWIGIGVMIFAVVSTFALLRFQAYVVRQSNSLAISADRLHYAGDLLMNGSVITSLVLSLWLDLPWIDPLFGIAIALYLAKTAYGIGRQAFDVLMDRELPKADRQRIVAIAAAHPEVKAVQDLRTRGSGPQIFIQFHTILSPELTLAKAHDVADQIEVELLKVFPGAEILIHQEPEMLPATGPAA